MGSRFKNNLSFELFPRWEGDLDGSSLSLNPSLMTFLPNSIWTARFLQRVFAVLAMCILAGVDLMAQRNLQSGSAALQGVETGLTDYIQPITNICYIIAALVAIVGGVQVYSKMTSGDPGAGKTAASWLGGAVFLILIPTIITALFGVNMA